jgi:hypothetical protein
MDFEPSGPLVIVPAAFVDGLESIGGSRLAHAREVQVGGDHYCYRIRGTSQGYSRGDETESNMKIKLLRASNTVKEIEFPATLPLLDIQRLSVDLMFENFERNQTHLWPREGDTRGSRHEIQVISDTGILLKSFDVREIIKDAGLKFLGRRVDQAPPMGDNRRN